MREERKKRVRIDKIRGFCFNIHYLNPSTTSFFKRWTCKSCTRSFVYIPSMLQPGKYDWKNHIHQHWMQFHSHFVTSNLFSCCLKNHLRFFRRWIWFFIAFILSRSHSMGASKFMCDMNFVCALWRAVWIFSVNFERFGCDVHWFM